MSSITKLASRFLGGGRRGSAGARPGSGPTSTTGTTGTTGGTDAAIGKGVRGVLRKLRR